MEQQSFTVHIPRQHHPHHRSKLSELSYVRPHTDKKAGHVAPPEGQGLEYEYAPIPGHEDHIWVVVTKNPHNVSAAHLKGEIEKGLKNLEL